MKRALVAQLGAVGACVALPDEEAHHLLQVRRLKQGELIELIDGRGGCVQGQLEVLGRRQAQVRVTQVIAGGDERPPVRESLPELVVGLALPTHLKTLDEMLPGLVQLGVQQLVLAPSRYGGQLKKAEDKYLARLESIASQAMKQCGRLVLPQIRLDADWPALCRGIAATCDAAVILHPATGTSSAFDDLGQKTRVGLLVGPEGGFHEDEVRLACEAGARILDLGPRILKMETAVIGACFWLRQTLG